MIVTFWSWFWKGTAKSKSGLRLLVNGRLVVHAIIALLLLVCVKSDPFEFAGKALFPAASILVSMAVAWTSRASTILQDNTFREMILSDKNPLEAYVYGYQLALLIIIGMVIYVSIMASGGLSFVLISPSISVRLSGFMLYFLLSLAITQCWQVIDFSNLLTLLHERVRK